MWLIPERLNRNILECKFDISPQGFLALAVLIETYWNVNVVQWNKFAKVRGVLIETYWNVNNEPEEKTKGVYES